MNEYVEADFLLELDGLLGLGLQERFVGSLVPLFSFVLRSSGPDFLCLWKRSNGCCRKQRQAEALLLAFAALGIRAGSPNRLFSNRVHANLDGGIVNPV